MNFKIQTFLKTSSVDRRLPLRSLLYELPWWESLGGTAVCQACAQLGAHVLFLSLHKYRVCDGGKSTVWGVQDSGSGSVHVCRGHSLIIFCV